MDEQRAAVRPAETAFGVFRRPPAQPPADTFDDSYEDRFAKPFGKRYDETFDKPAGESFGGSAEQRLDEPVDRRFDEPFAGTHDDLFGGKLDEPYQDCLIEDTEEQPLVPTPSASSSSSAEPKPAGRTLFFQPAPKQPRWGLLRGLLVVGVLAVLTATGLSIALNQSSAPERNNKAAGAGAGALAASDFPTPAGSTPAAPAPVSSARDGRTASAPLSDTRDREFVLVTGTSTVKISSADLDDRLFVATTPAGGTVDPSAAVDQTSVQLQLIPNGRQGPGSAEIRLSSHVRWHLRLSGGAVEYLVDMAEGHLSGLDINGGATRVELWLPDPAGTTSIRMTGGANQVLLHAPDGVPVRVRARKGGSNVTIDTLDRSSIAPGALFTPPGWDGAANRYDVDAVAGFATLTVDRAISGTA